MFYMSTQRTTTKGVTMNTEAMTHRVRWFVYDTAGNQMRHESSMRGQWSYDAKCACGWETMTGGATRESVRGQVEDHKASEGADAYAEVTK